MTWTRPLLLSVVGIGLIDAHKVEQKTLDLDLVGQRDEQTDDVHKCTEEAGVVATDVCSSHVVGMAKLRHRCDL